MKRSKKVVDLTRNAGYKQKPGVELAEKGHVVTPYKPVRTREGATAHFKGLRELYAAEKKRKEEDFKKKTLPLTMRKLVERLSKKPFAEWTPSDMSQAERILTPEIVYVLSEKAKKLE